MRELTADPLLLQQLGDLSNGVFLRDESGRAVGYVLSYDVFHALADTDSAPVTEQELDQARNDFAQSGGRSLKEVWAQLRADGVPGVPEA